MASASEGLSSYLFSEAESHVAAMGRHLGAGAAQGLRQLTERAEATLLKAGPENLTNETEKARLAMFDLLDKAEEIARGLPNYAPDQLGERSFYPALKWFCPRYPFC